MHWITSESSDPKERYKELESLLDEKGECIEYIITANRSVDSIYAASIHRKPYVPNAIVITCNEKLNNASTEIKYAIFGHEVGHYLAGHMDKSRAETQRIQRARMFGCSSAHKYEIEADRYSIQVSCIGTKEFLDTYLKCAIALEYTSAINEAKARLIAFDKNK